MTPQQIAEKPGRYPAATLYEAVEKRGDRSPDIRPIVPGVPLSGIACTIRTFPSDSTGALRALVDAPPRFVLVVDAGGTGRAGGNMPA